MSSRAEQYSLYQIANAPLRDYPYPHILVHEVFEPQLYRRMLEHLLPESLMHPIKQVRALDQSYSDQRFIFTLTPDDIGRLPPPYAGFWTELCQWLLAMPLAEVLLQKFSATVERRFRGRDPGIYNEAMLVDDRCSYSLGPHSDKPSKVITLLFYLPADGSRAHLGTSLYIPRERAFRCRRGLHYPFEFFERVVTLPYVSNTLFAFAKTDNSFHGVEPLADRDYRRHLLFYDLYCNVEADNPAEPAGGDSESAAGPSVEFTF